MSISTLPQRMEIQMYVDKIVIQLLLWLHDILFQLQPYLEQGEHRLSMDTDVLLWIESKEFHNKPALRKVSDFVVVNILQHCELDEFKSRRIDHHYSVLRINSLLDYWNHLKGPNHSPH